MTSWAVGFLIMATLTALLGLTGTAAAAVELAIIFFVMFLVCLAPTVISLAMRRKSATEQ